jgi:uncharacterized sodium:solute symporter family permease YidK
MKNKFGKTYEMIQELCFVVFIICCRKPNNGMTGSVQFSSVYAVPSNPLQIQENLSLQYIFIYVHIQMIMCEVVILQSNNFNLI